MELVFEFLFSLIIEGSFEAARDSEVPWAVRIVAAVICLLVIGGIFGVLLYAAIRSRDGVFIAIAVGVTVLVVGGLVLGMIRKGKTRK